MCHATGVPEPVVQWRREGGKDIILRNEARERQSTLYFTLLFFLNFGKILKMIYIKKKYIF